MPRRMVSDETPIGSRTIGSARELAHDDAAGSGDSERSALMTNDQRSCPTKPYWTSALSRVYSV